MRSTIQWFLLVLLSMSAWSPLHAQGGDSSSTRYISDDTKITLRQDKSLEAPVSGLLSSGTRVELIESDTASGYARVRAGAGREGWVLSRYLTAEPSARERLGKVEAQLAEQREAGRVLSEENERLRAQGNDPAASATDGPVAGGGSGRILAPAGKRPGEVAAMLTGAGLFVVGLLAGLLVPLLPRMGARRGNGSR